MSTLCEITSKADLSSHLATLSPSTLLVLYFYTPWTEFSTRLGANLSKLISQYPVTASSTISLLGINAKELLETAKEYGIAKAPWVICLRDGQVLESIRGSDTAAVCNAIQSHAGVETIPVPAVPDYITKQSKDALIARLVALVKAAPIMLFMKGTPSSPLCRFSRRMVRILSENNIEYDSFNVITDEDVRQGMKEFANYPTFPQLWVDGELVGGLDIVRAEISANPNFMGKYTFSKAVPLVDSV